MTESTHVAPEWQPPDGLRDPFVRRLEFKRGDKKGRATWSRLSRGRITGPREQAVAWRLADYGNKDGHNCHPGMARLASDTCSSEKTVRRAMAWLAENGWCRVEQRGRRKLGEADVYVLTIPAPVAASAGLWTPAGGAQWMERPSDEPARPELRRPAPSFPEVNGDRYSEVLEVTPDFLEVTGDVSPVSVDLPPGPKHQGLSTPSSGSTTGARQVAREVWDDVKTLSPDDLEYDDLLLNAIEDHVGHLRIDVESAVRGMLASGEHPRLVVNKALQMHREAS